VRTAGSTGSVGGGVAGGGGELKYQEKPGDTRKTNSELLRSGPEGVPEQEVNDAVIATE